MMTNNIIEFQNISKHFGVTKALENVSFEIKRGECHAIVGENGAGKSTLMNLLSGIFPQNSGKILYNGKSVRITSPHASNELGIATVYQELKLCHNLTVLENIFLGRTSVNKLGIIKKGDMSVSAQEMIDVFNIAIDVNTPVRNLSIAQMQLVELAKAIGRNSDVLILDEPTSSLTATESHLLFNILRHLKAKGKTLIFISHRLAEIFEISDRISIMRDGQYIGTYNNEDLDENKIVKLITGDKLYQEIYTDREKNETSINNENRKVVLGIKNLSRGKLIKDVNFKLYEGEILGIYGLQGSGRTELLETIFGLYPAQKGDIYLYGSDIPEKIKSPYHAIKNEIGLITEDRKNRGIFHKMNIKENIAVIHNKDVTNAKFIISKNKIKKMATFYCKELLVKTSGLTQNILNLSGGNQQKVIIARIMSKNPRIILADEPTRGVDVGAKAEIFSIFRRLSLKNISTIIVSSELKEIVKECDRVLVMRNGHMVGEIYERNGREEKILDLAFNG